MRKDAKSITNVCADFRVMRRRAESFSQVNANVSRRDTKRP